MVVTTAVRTVVAARAEAARGAVALTVAVEGTVAATVAGRTVVTTLEGTATTVDPGVTVEGAGGRVSDDDTEAAAGPTEG